MGKEEGADDGLASSRLPRWIGEPMYGPQKGLLYYGNPP